jgi:hypothetical protein
MFDLARRRNTIQLPKSSAPHGSILLPPLRGIMLSENHLSVGPIKPPPDQVVETEDADEVSDPEPTTEFSVRASKKQEQKHQPSQRVSSTDYYSCHQTEQDERMNINA